MAIIGQPAVSQLRVLSLVNKYVPAAVATVTFLFSCTTESLMCCSMSLDCGGRGVGSFEKYFRQSAIFMETANVTIAYAGPTPIFPFDVSSCNLFSLAWFRAVPSGAAQPRTGDVYVRKRDRLLETVLVVW